MSASKTYETILVERRDRVGLITLNRPDALNALNRQIMLDVTDAVSIFEADDGIGAMVITGSAKAFAAGADIKEMQVLDYMDVFKTDKFGPWDILVRARKPVIAAVAGFALGGGCELAMMCDFILAADTAKFGQPEIKLGVVPGMGGTQRFTRAVGKAKAMDMCLTGRMMDAAEAERSGLVARIIPADKLLDEAIATAQTIASMSMPVAMMVKECVNIAQEVPLADGLRFEKRVFHSTFSLADQKEGMTAFVEKRKPNFKNA
ncbi:enoyl-CoA hydratase [Methylocella sp. CPCC 101449]|jgi:enoyl-CoA hydratase|uniref:enoyl-CoA hydratase n=1 Tax=Methylocella sp. CPCC 101449 TaxID=2987531 RepID=UPI002890AE7C|nr:enoyl-CoA hydratase [Methylocella sp. CPCC 101449]MDT2019341.1 enoyl-CoA hydratase [Methylocella sp. CPCC 101449]HEV2573259.1 enoyl-CoA hydratase [Beijerinckiaceae bacterium]